MIPRPEGLGYYRLLTLFRRRLYSWTTMFYYSRFFMRISILFSHKTACVCCTTVGYLCHDRIPFWLCHSRKAPFTIPVCHCARSIAFATLASVRSRVTGFFRSGRTIRPERFSSFDRLSTTDASIIPRRICIPYMQKSNIVSIAYKTKF